MVPGNSPLNIGFSDMIILPYNTIPVFLIKAMKYSSVACWVIILNHIKLTEMKNFLKFTGNQKQVTVMLRSQLESLGERPDWRSYSWLKSEQSCGNDKCFTSLPEFPADMDSKHNIVGCRIVT